MNESSTQRMSALAASVRRLLMYFQQSGWMAHGSDPDSCDFAFGNPHDMAMPAYVEALREAAIPRDPNWFAYKMSEPYAQETVAASLRARFGLPFEPADIAMTTGGSAALFAAMTALLDPGDEVIYNLPPWFCYEMGVLHAGGVPVKVRLDAETFDLDLAAIEAAITLKTRLVLINTPNNPTGRIYTPETLTRLGEMLADASARIGRTIYLLSDEAYSHIVFDGATFHTPLEFYSDSLLAYSYGKTLLAPGQRIGYLALNPAIANRERLRNDILIAQIANSYSFPNAILQRALPELEKLSIDVGQMQRKRDRMVSALREIGYSVHPPEGTFYLFPKSPIEDDWTFIRLLEEEKIFCHPGTINEWPGYFRISLTASEEMIERSLPGFANAFAHSAVVI
jgi:aspartate aminotransferase